MELRSNKFRGGMEDLSMDDVESLNPLPPFSPCLTTGSNSGSKSGSKSSKSPSTSKGKRDSIQSETLTTLEEAKKILHHDIAGLKDPSYASPRTRSKFPLMSESGSMVSETPKLEDVEAWTNRADLIGVDSPRDSSTQAGQQLGSSSPEVLSQFQSVNRRSIDNSVQPLYNTFGRAASVEASPAGPPDAFVRTTSAPTAQRRTSEQGLGFDDSGRLISGFLQLRDRRYFTLRWVNVWVMIDSDSNLNVFEGSHVEPMMVLELPQYTLLRKKNTLVIELERKDKAENKLNPDVLIQFKAHEPDEKKLWVSSFREATLRLSKDALNVKSRNPKSFNLSPTSLTGLSPKAFSDGSVRSMFWRAFSPTSVKSLGFSPKSQRSTSSPEPRDNVNSAPAASTRSQGWFSDKASKFYSYIGSFEPSRLTKYVKPSKPKPQYRDWIVTG
mmetsp:Transcript_23914/g.37441  ORF Transcript_23914/g.37441 Transcript_23914/m.37441 type:complete len:441 (-) Transcript_23914:436-1758(-)|eukprot:CAMPEP_0184290370 /NCGR_PEP_ID=MMETSP1049-20130417/2647_1 /TAXON_ID=77928 /ORGANISM="Proteomonas sulcata, Strain CCMP704" /LENGTH=440 /DNA_ID=CAMNT_0026597513 /DNA_START=188 /DNA_END=1510 /DNA_ORIENTATION=+